MATIEVRNLSHSYDGKKQVLRPLSFTWEDGKTYALLGPSGCGKTTLLNILSGLLSPSEGQVLIDGIDVTKKTPAHRNIGQVFQFPIVYDSLTVRQNLAFPLRRSGLSKEEVSDIVCEVASILEMRESLDVPASNLSPHLKQLISLGRGLVRKDINGILLDEPLTTIDPSKKAYIRRKLREFHHQRPVTMILVTHDQTEAMTFADEILVMNGGDILQSGSPEEIFHRPAHPFVGQFIGSPGMNFIKPSLSPEGLYLGNKENGVLNKKRNYNSPPLLGIRPQHIQIQDKDQAFLEGFRLKGVVEGLTYKSTNKVCEILVEGGLRIKATTSVFRHFDTGQTLDLVLPFDNISVFSEDLDASSLDLWD